ncbi:hypothetical protein PROFUN_15474 [Planoprotostelium fungivorum]|uniref:Uncharacterized protein n=1 Tax=Planoprotostelium fungivorum TaxID=1890364 RepID=A0A2P6MUP6_9EUKA|nr:hypothetical protein PROFUN_15474 [Planoprotostelium fungivorum]
MAATSQRNHLYQLVGNLATGGQNDPTQPQITAYLNHILTLDEPTCQTILLVPAQIPGLVKNGPPVQGAAPTVSFPKAQLLFLVGSCVLLVPAILTSVFTYESSEKAAANLAATNSTASNYAAAQDASTWAGYAARTTIPNAILLAVWTLGKDAITFHYARVTYSKAKKAAQPASLLQDQPGPGPLVDPSNQPELRGGGSQLRTTLLRARSSKTETSLMKPKFQTNDTQCCVYFFICLSAAFFILCHLERHFFVTDGYSQFTRSMLKAKLWSIDCAEMAWLRAKQRDKTYDRFSPHSPNLSFYSSQQQGVNSPPPVDSGTPHHPGKNLNHIRRIAMPLPVPQFTYIYLFCYFFLGLPTGLQSSKLSVGQQWLNSP